MEENKPITLEDARKLLKAMDRAEVGHSIAEFAAFILREGKFDNTSNNRIFLKAFVEHVHAFVETLDLECDLERKGKDVLLKMASDIEVKFKAWEEEAAHEHSAADNPVSDFAARSTTGAAGGNLAGRMVQEGYPDGNPDEPT